MRKSKNANRNKWLDKKDIRKGLSIYKTSNSPYWYVRMLVVGERRYITRSTNETARIKATIAAEELLKDLNEGTELKGTPRHKQFQHFAHQLVKDQQKTAGKERSKTYSRNDEQTLNRK